MGQNLISNDDVVIAANEPIAAGGAVDNSSGDIVLRTSGVERARIDKDGFGTGMLSGSQPFPEQTVVIFGDSVTNQNTDGSDGVAAFGSRSARGYWTWASMFLGHRFLLLNNGGVGGNTTTQMLARLQTDALNYAPGFFVVSTGGDNDVTSGFTSAQTITNLQSIVQQMLKTGATVILTTCLPTTSATTALQQANLLAVNNWMRGYVYQTRGVLLVDFFSIMADPAVTMAPQANLSYDGVIHPSQLGAYRLGRALAAVFQPFVPPQAPLPFSNTETVNGGYSLPNPRMIGNSAGVATSTTIAANSGTPTLTKSKVARTDIPQGEWQQVVATGGTDEFHVQQQANLNVGAAGAPQVGDRVYAVCEVEIDPGATMVGFSGERPVGLEIINQDASGTPAIWDNYLATAAGTYPGTGQDIPSGRLVLRTPNYLLPTGSSRLFVRAAFFVNGTVRVGRMQVYKSTSTTLYG